MSLQNRCMMRFVSKNIVLYLILVLMVSCLAGCFDLAATHSLSKNKQYIFTNKAEVYVMRGGLGGVFSTGMNRLQHTLEAQYRIKTESTVWYRATALGKDIIKRYKNNPSSAPLVLVGHSLGANEQIKVADMLEKAHIPVALLITVDAVSPITIPANVAHVVNIYKPSFMPMFSGLRVIARDPLRTYIENINVDKLTGVSVNHFTIEKNQNIQQLMLTNVLKAVHYVK